MKLSDINFKSSVFTFIGTAPTSPTSSAACLVFAPEESELAFYDVLNYLALPDCNKLNSLCLNFKDADEHDYFYNQIVDRHRTEAREIIDRAVDFEGKKFTFLN